MQPARHTGLELPEPDQESACHSRRVADHICQQIKEEGGSISFADYMQHALYAPGLGYYVSGTTKFGAAGDFVTAPEISPLFGNVLARQIAAVWEQVADRQIFELGAGSGVLAAAILRKLSLLNALPDRYFILEVSADLQQRQQQHLSGEVPDLAARVEWLSELPVEFSGVVVANEVADALPVERFTKPAARSNKSGLPWKTAGSSGIWMKPPTCWPQPSTTSKKKSADSFPTTTNRKSAWRSGHGLTTWSKA